MNKRAHLIKYFLAVFAAVILLVCIFGIPLKGVKTSVKSDGTTASGSFTGMWSPIRGKEGTFVADAGWVFEGVIKPDGGLLNGELTNYPIDPESRANSLFELPALYTGSVENTILVDVALKNS